MYGIVFQVLVRLYLEVPENLNVLLLQNLITFVLPPFVSCWYIIFPAEVPVQH